MHISIVRDKDTRKYLVWREEAPTQFKSSALPKVLGEAASIALPDPCRVYYAPADADCSACVWCGATDATWTGRKGDWILVYRGRKPEKARDVILSYVGML